MYSVLKLFNRSFKPKQLDATKYTTTLLYTDEGYDMYSYSLLVPKSGKGPTLIRQSGGLAIKSDYSVLKY